MWLPPFGEYLLEVVAPFLESIAPIMPGEIFPYFFTLTLLQRALIAAILVTMVAGFLGCFLLTRNLALIGDGLAHVSFGGIAVGIVLGGMGPLWYALIFSIIAAVFIHELQSREILTGDASIAIFSTGMLALGLVVLRLEISFELPLIGLIEMSPVGITNTVEGYLYGNLYLLNPGDLDLIVFISVISFVILFIMRHGLLATTIDPLAAKIQGVPVRLIGLLFSILTAAVVVSMVKIIGALLVTALLVTPAATGQLVGRSFRECILYTQLFGLSSVLLGIYLSAELDTGGGSMIALVTACMFAIVVISQAVIRSLIKRNENLN